MLKRKLGVLCAALAVILLAGCEPAPVYSPPSKPPLRPIFDSEEDAMAAAEEAWNLYLAAYNVMVQSGGTNTRVFSGIVGDEQFEREQEDAERLIEDREHIVGDFVSYDFRLQQWFQDEIGVFLQAYVCLDPTSAVVLGEDGSVHRYYTDVIPFEVMFDTPEEPAFTVTELREWTGRDFCVRS